MDSQDKQDTESILFILTILLNGFLVISISLCL